MKNKHYDIIIIGGGATGAGIALDAALRGLSVKLFEQNDFGEGTSSRSTKLVHGGVRYLEAAIKHLDIEQWKLVREGLRERKSFLNNASHLAHPIELITPIYKWYEMPYVYAGLLMYDIISGRHRLGSSRLIGAKKTLERSSAINPAGLKGAVSYFDGAFNDARMVIALLQSAEQAGAQVHNYHQVTQLLKNSDGKITGVEIHDKIEDVTTKHYATAVINATGPFTDNIRLLDDPKSTPLIETSSGIHIVLPAYFLPKDQGVMIPKTSDGRLLFALPYGKHCMIGTTDNPAKLSEHPQVTEDEIDFLLEHYNKYFSTKASRDDVLSVFSGLRPLIVSDKHSSTSTLVRESEYIFSTSGLLTVTGGKWTSYRAMAEKAVDLIVEKNFKSNKPKKCSTLNHKVVGSIMPRVEVIRKLKLSPKVQSVAEHLYSLYGDRSLQVVKYGNKKSDLEPVLEALQISKSEIIYTIHHEYVRKPLDFIVRRSGLGLVDRKKSLEILPIVVSIIAKELQWSESFKNNAINEAKERLNATI